MLILIETNIRKSKIQTLMCLLFALVPRHDFLNSSCSLFLYRCVFDTLPNHVRPRRYTYIFVGGVFGSVRQPRPGVSMESNPSSTR